MFSNGKAITLPPVRAVYLFAPVEEKTDPDLLKAGFTVSAKNFKRAVDRNRIKRILREAYRTQKSLLLRSAAELNTRVSVFFVFTSRNVEDTALVGPQMLKALEAIHGKLTAAGKTASGKKNTQP